MDGALVAVAATKEEQIAHLPIRKRLRNSIIGARPDGLVMEIVQKVQLPEVLVVIVGGAAVLKTYTSPIGGEESVDTPLLHNHFLPLHLSNILTDSPKREQKKQTDKALSQHQRLSLSKSVVIRLSRNIGVVTVSRTLVLIFTCAGQKNGCNHNAKT